MYYSEGERTAANKNENYPLENRGKENPYVKLPTGLDYGSALISSKLPPAAIKSLGT